MNNPSDTLTRFAHDAYVRIHGWRDRRSYFQYEEDNRHLVGLLFDEPSLTVRADIIDTLANNVEAQANVYRRAFGPDPIPDENGRDMRDSLQLEVGLLRQVADASLAAGQGEPRRFRQHGETPEVAAALDGLAGVWTHKDWHEGLGRLLDAVLPAVGGQTAEVLATLQRTHRRLAYVTLMCFR